MSISLAMMVKDPPIDQLVTLVDFVQPTISDIVIAVDDRTLESTINTMKSWPNVTVVPFTWTDDFAEARNVALPYCKGDWTLILDPDELPTTTMMEFLKPFKRRYIDSSDDTYCYLFLAKNYWNGNKAEEFASDWHIRIFKTGKGRFYRPLHELVEMQIDGKWVNEEGLRGTSKVIVAPEEAYFIHSKTAQECNESNVLYARITNAVP
jgi:hypothetical protein